MILVNAEDRAMAVYGQGYWADHWDYYIVSNVLGLVVVLCFPALTSACY